MIGAWLAGKVSGIIIFVLACLSVPLGVGLAIESVRLNGLSIVGWEIAPGYKPMYARDEIALVTLRSNNQALSDGITVCNASVDQLHAAGAKAQADAQALIDQHAKDAASLRSNIAALNAIKSTGEKCPVGETILQGAFK